MAVPNVMVADPAVPEVPVSRNTANRIQSTGIKNSSPLRSYLATFFLQKTGRCFIVTTKNVHTFATNVLPQMQCILHKK